MLTLMGVTLIDGELYHQRKKKEDKCSYNSEASNST